MNIKSVKDFREALSEPYAWPGGYPKFFITSSGDALSYAAANENKGDIESAISNKANDGWRVIAVDINWEDDELYCDHTGEPIESAYGF